jgi:hypothetical protein
MIDRTSNRIEQQESALRRRNKRRYAFQTLLTATDRMLWRLEELNRDGAKTMPVRVRAELRELCEGMPRGVRASLRDTGQVQDALDSLFEVQEHLFKWRYPDWHDWDPEEHGEELDRTG